MDDAADFFDLDEFAVAVTRYRPGASDQNLAAIIGYSEESVLDGNVLGAIRTMAYATGPDLRDGDTVTVVGTGSRAIHNGTYRVHEPHAVNDGDESRARLTRIAP